MNKNLSPFQQVKGGKIVFINWANSEDWPIEYVSDNIYEMLNYTPEEIISKNITYGSLIHPEDLERVRKEVRNAISSNKDEFSHSFYRIKDSNGSYHTIYDHTKVVRDRNNQVTGFQGYIYDETESFIQKERLSLVLEGTALGLWDWNPQTNEVFFDERWAQMLGYSLSEIEPSITSWESRVHPDDLEGCYKDIQAHIMGETDFYNNIHRMMHKDGKWRYILDRGKVVERDNKGNPVRFTGTHTDITVLKEVQIELEKSNRELQIKNEYISNIAQHDGLTGVYNRRNFDEKLQGEWERWKRNGTDFALLMIDIDFFKKYNDTYGHQAGDDALKMVASVLDSSACRKNDYVARYGGEEFAIILADNLSREDAFRIAQNIVKDLLNKKIEHCGSNISSYLTLSIGFSMASELNKSSIAQDLILLSDKALYRAKKSGRNRASK